ncbi:LysR family transcriptional regulator [Advenella kashmirensis W13003]|uniref:LysR family transcriptional regulator n=1 Tax=Advenella kashmirensis W13003 TaxID=1424334 RepID=V8QWV2_9BURK|nr:LysR family transcriptional regulator [Advenella kashmirensis]ETF04107.1 LysR family transcriptional regulator [Advenella kashmirensis W13003]
MGTASKPTRSNTLRFDLLELETFLTVVDSGSFNAAAGKLHISQPAVTHRIQRLEAILHTRLLLRTTRRMEPTEAGRRLYEQATLALQDLRMLLADFQAEAEQGQRRVVVAASPIIAAQSLPSIIQHFTRRYPAADVHIRDMQHDEILAALQSGAADLGVVAFEGDPALFRFEPLGEDEMAVVVPGEHPLASKSAVTLACLSEYPLLLLQQYDRIQQQIAQAMQAQALICHFAPRLTNLTTLLAMLDTGHGVAILPRSMAQTNIQRPRVALSLAELRMTRCFGILLARKARLSNAAHHFCEQLREDFGATLATTSGGAPGRG